MPVRQTRDPISDESNYACWSNVGLQSTRQENDTVSDLYRVNLLPMTFHESEAFCLDLTTPLSSAVLATQLEEDEVLRERLTIEINDLLQRTQQSLSGVWVAPFEDQRDSSNQTTQRSCQRLDLNTHQLEPTSCELELPTLCELSRSPL